MLLHVLANDNEITSVTVKMHGIESYKEINLHLS